MKIAQLSLAFAAAVVLVSSGASAEQLLMGTISKVDAANGKLAIQPMPSGTVGASTGNAAEEFKLLDGLMFNAVQAGDRVVFSVSEVNGIKTITKLERQ